MPQSDKPDSVVETILKLKKTASPINGAPMGYREIGLKLDLTGAGVKWHTRNIMKHRCPLCLQKLTTEKPTK